MLRQSKVYICILTIWYMHSIQYILLLDWFFLTIEMLIMFIYRSSKYNYGLKVYQAYFMTARSRLNKVDILIKYHFIKKKIANRTKKKHVPNTVRIDMSELPHIMEGPPSPEVVDIVCDLGRSGALRWGRWEDVDV